MSHTHQPWSDTHHTTYISKRSSPKLLIFLLILKATVLHSASHKTHEHKTNDQDSYPARSVSMLPTPCYYSSAEFPEKHHKVRRELMVLHVLSVLISLTHLTEPCWDHRARTQMDNYMFLKLFSVPALNLETCGSKFPLFFPFPLKYINSISLSICPTPAQGLPEEAEAAATAQTATLTAFKAKK